MENYEINKNIESFTKRLNDLKEAIDLSGLIKQIEEDEKIIADPNFYNDLANSQIVLKQVKKHKDIYEKFKSIEIEVNDLECYYQMQKNGEVSEEDINNDIVLLIKNIDTELTAFEEKRKRSLGQERSFFSLYGLLLRFAFLLRRLQLRAFDPFFFLVV